MTSGSRMACRTRAAPAPSASSATPTGKPFHTTTLRRVLTNPRMPALRVHRGEVIGEASWEPVISRGDFERLRGLFSGRPRQRIGRPQTYPYSGLLRCGEEAAGAARDPGACDRAAGRAWRAPPGRGAAAATLARVATRADHPAPRLGIGRGDMAGFIPESTAPTSYQQGRLPAPTAPMPPAALNLPRELPP